MTSAGGQGIGRRALFAALAAFALVVPAAAQAKPPKTFYGVTPQAQVGAYELERMGLGRVGTLRVSIPWAALDQSAVPGDTDWSLIDQLVGSSAQVGIQVLPVFDNVPTWVAQLDNCKSACYRHAPRGELSLMAWRDFLRSAVQRYGPEGSYWVQHPEVPKKAIRAWQIWNEQNSAQYFSPKPDADVYANLVAEASGVIKEEDPGAKVVLGGMFATPMGEAGNPRDRSWVYLRRLYRAGAGAHFDGVAVHPYSRTMKQVRQQVQLMRTEMKRARDRGASLWVTEIGWSSQRGSYYLEVGKKPQARLLRKSFRYFTRQRKRLNIKTVSWFSWRDTPPEFELCIWCPSSGLFTRDGFAPKPAWRAFTRFTRGS